MRNIITIILLLFTLTQPSFSAGSSGDSGDSKSNYDKAIPFIKAGNKLEKKRKNRKSKTKV